jgi:hypothetical protein
MSTTVLKDGTPIEPTDLELKDEERQPCEIWTRVMGYHRPVSSFNRGKQGEYHERLYFRLDRVDLREDAA